MTSMSAPELFDYDLIRARQTRARLDGQTDDVLLPRVSEEMAERLAGVLRDFDNALDLGTPEPGLSGPLLALPRVSSIRRADMDLLNRDYVLPFAEGSLDLVASALALHWVEDLPGLLVQIRRALKSDGLFMAAVPGGDTLIELREAFSEAEADTAGGVSPRVIPFAGVRDLGSLLQRAGFALPVVDSDKITVRYGDIFGLFRDLRSLGATNPLLARSKTPLRRETLARLAEIYQERFSDPDGRLRVTVEIVWMSGWVPHESQQKPLRPGSARHRLADALGTVEIPSGVKPG
jgi:SAM-dependent methyltransferase